VFVTKKRKASDSGKTISIIRVFPQQPSRPHFVQETWTLEFEEKRMPGYRFRQIDKTPANRQRDIYPNVVVYRFACQHVNPRSMLRFRLLLRIIAQARLGSVP
jgi:hypothetical protein